MFEHLHCSHASVCSGCDLLEKPYDEQRALKINHLTRIWEAALPTGPALPDIEWIGVAGGGLRDRADLMIDSRSGVYKLGLFDQNRTGIVDLAACPQMSPRLEEWLREFRRNTLPVGRGSVRLRVSPSGRKGVWLDLANIDVKALLDERTTLEALRTHAVVEIGQRRKRLVERDGALKLADPVLEPWFETYGGRDGAETSLPLYCTIGSFTQPGFTANRALVRTVRRAITRAGARHVVEFGSGIGNFTLPLAASTDCERVDAYEVDRLATQGLRRSLAETGLENKVRVFEGDFQTGHQIDHRTDHFCADRRVPIDFSGVDLVLADPPRSGLMKFLDPLIALKSAARPPWFVSVSCFAESFAADSARLIDAGYCIDSLAIVDQFPQSRHYEVVATFRL